MKWSPTDLNLGLEHSSKSSEWHIDCTKLKLRSQSKLLAKKYMYLYLYFTLEDTSAVKTNGYSMPRVKSLRILPGDIRYAYIQYNTFTSHHITISILTMRHRHQSKSQDAVHVLIGALLLPQVFFQATLEGRIAQVAQRRRQLVIFRYGCEQVAPPSGLWSNDRRQKHITLRGVSLPCTLCRVTKFPNLTWLRCAPC